MHSEIPSFKDNVIAFTEALGPEYPHFILPFSATPWPSEAARTEFLEGLTGGGAGG